jgi:hypothetical protein
MIEGLFGWTPERPRDPFVTPASPVFAKASAGTNTAKPGEADLSATNA